MAWLINGEAGKTMDATQRSMETLRIDQGRLAFGSLATDALTWEAATDNATGAGTVVPDTGQLIEIFHGATRRFKGHATKVRVGTRSVAVTVEGPWWWMTRTPLTQNQLDATSVSAERASYVFPTQSLKTSIETLIDRAIANGVPMVRGAIAEMFTVPKITLAEMNCASALAELMRWVPDAVAWFDYSGTVPVLNISRRGTATALNLAIGTDPLEELSISPRLDLEVQRVELNFVDRNPTTGKPRWQAQTSGAAVPGKRQIVTISGPEIVDFLPRDDFDSVSVRTVLWTAATNNFIRSNDSELAAIFADYGSILGSAYEKWIWYSGTSTGKTYNERIFPSPSLRSISGQTIPSGTKWLVTSSAPLPEWARLQLGAIEVELAGTWVAAWKDSEQGFGVGWSPMFEALQAGAQTKNNNWENGSPYSGSASAAGSAGFYVDWLARPFAVRGYVINQSFASLTPVYKAWDYDYLTPPAGLAAALTAAQNWVPWEGTVGLVDPAATGENLMARKINLAGCLPACATMGALLSGMSYELLSERTIYELGAPARTDFGSLVSRIRREPKDNIVYL